jgi:hypothetical protein
LKSLTNNKNSKATKEETNGSMKSNLNSSIKTQHLPYHISLTKIKSSLKQMEYAPISVLNQKNHNYSAEIARKK